MGKIVCLMGKSSTGKDTIYKELLKRKNIAFRTVVSYTTRPIRAGEQEGVEYHLGSRLQHLPRPLEIFHRGRRQDRPRRDG